ncbi:MAG: HAD family hydrolase, partial [Candidatus Omnitrophota bacterium]
MKNTKLIIFDLDGTLLDAYAAIIDTFNYVMRRLNYPKQSNTTIRKAVGWGDANLLKPFVKGKDLSSALAVYRSHHKLALLKGSRLFPHVRSLLSVLKRKGYKLAVASNRPTRFSRILIRHLKLGKYFDYILCADRLKHPKPHPQILNTIMRRFRVSPDEAVYVGDMA